MPNLIFERGREKGTSFELKPETPVVAGRDPAAVQIVLSDPAASRRHFQVAAREGKWFVTDLGSRNATYVNEEKLAKEKDIELSSGDRIQVGETVLSFLDEAKDDKGAGQGLNGKELGGYKILDRLGRGGMGTVFKAKQISLNRVIALKVLASKFAKDPKFVEKFVSEARAAGQLNHPNVVQVFDVGQLGGLHFFSMELMEGGCVQDLLSAAPEGRLTWQESMPLILDAARGLVFAEKRGIIHRDIKPDNLMLTSEQRVKIGDLGLAKKAEEGAGDKQIFGTPHFIAPEQAQGKDLTHSADLYALGATFYRMVVGTTPFSGETVKEILRKQINDPHKPIRETVPDFPEDLAAIVDKLMAKKVENRYQSATKLVEDLEGFQLAHQIELSGASKLSKPLMIALTVVTLGAIGVGVWFATRPEKVTTIEKQGETVYVKEEGPKLTEEDKLRMREADVKVELSELQLDDARLAPVTLEKRAEYEKLADRYDALTAKYEDPRLAGTIKPATERAKEIREHLKTKQAEAEDRVRATETLWTDVKAKLADHESKNQWSEEIRYAEKLLKDAKYAEMLAAVKDAKPEVEKVHEKALGLAEADLNASAKLADEKFKAGDAEAGIKLLDDWADAVEKSNPPDEKLKTLAADARQNSQTMRTTRNDQLLALIDQDRLTYVLALRGLRQGGTSGMGLVFDLDFDGAAAQLKTATEPLKTWPYRDRADAVVARLTLAHKAWTDWVKLLGDGKLFAAGDELHGLPGAKAGDTFKLRLDDKPTAQKFVVDKQTSVARAKTPMDWADLTREELANIFVLPKADKLPADVALGLSWLFVSLDHAPAAQSLLDRATAAGVQITPEEETALRREITTIGTWDEFRRKAQGGADPKEILNLASAWRSANETFGTDAYVLHDGRSEREPAFRVVTQDKIDLYVQHLGKKPEPPK